MAFGCSSTGISPRPMLVGAPRNALRAFNAGVSLSNQRALPMCRHTHSPAPVRLLYPAGKIMARYRPSARFGSSYPSALCSFQGSKRAVHQPEKARFADEAFLTDMQKRRSEARKGVETRLWAGLAYAALFSLKFRILVMSFVSSLRFISSSTQRCGTPFASYSVLVAKAAM